MLSKQLSNSQLEKNKNPSVARLWHCTAEKSQRRQNQVVAFEEIKPDAITNRPMIQRQTLSETAEQFIFMMSSMTLLQ